MLLPTYHGLFAVLLLSLPLPAGEQMSLPTDDPLMPWAVRSVAVEWELLDSRWQQWSFTNDCAGDLSDCRRLYAELWLAPRDWEATRFPLSAEECWAEMQFAGEYIAVLEARRAWEPWRWSHYSALLGEAHLYREVYDYLQDAKHEHSCITSRRRALLRVRELIGHDSFYRGQLPPVVPLHQFRSAN